MNPILIAKLAAGIAVIAAIFFTGYHVGGLAPKAALEAQHAAWATATANALIAQRAASDAEATRLNKVIHDYESTPIDPIAVGLTRRLYVYAASHCDSMPSAPSVAAGTQTPSPQPIGPSGVERALGDLIEACAADARQLDAMIQLAP